MTSAILIAILSAGVIIGIAWALKVGAQLDRKWQLEAHERQSDIKDAWLVMSAALLEAHGVDPAESHKMAGDVFTAGGFWTQPQKAETAADVVKALEAMADAYNGEYPPPSHAS